MSFEELLGQKIKGYLLDEILGEGGMGVVYRAHHPLIGKRVAIKVLQGHQNPTAVSRFVLEAKAVNDIRHENLIDILDFDELPTGNPYIIMEYLEGCPLDEALKEAPFSVEQVGHIGLQLCSALYAAHQKGIVHRDLKGENVFLITRAGQTNFVKVLDFGIAKLLDTPGKHRTESNTLLGTPLYMAPEQITGAPIDARTDIYALGVLLYQMVTGAPPFYDPAPMVLLAMQVTATPAPPSQKVKSTPPLLEEAILQCLQKSPGDRFESMAALAAALGEACGLDAGVYLGDKLMSQRLSISAMPSVQKPAQDSHADASAQTAPEDELDLKETMLTMPQMNPSQRPFSMRDTVQDDDAAVEVLEKVKAMLPNAERASLPENDVRPTTEMTREEVLLMTGALPHVKKRPAERRGLVLLLGVLLPIGLFGLGFGLWWFVLRPS